MLDPVKNFAKVTVSTGYNSSATSIVLSGGDGAKLPQPSTDGAFNIVWWNSTDYPDPADDPNVEIVRCTVRSTDTLTVSRGQESTSASNKNTANKTYLMILSPTKKMTDDIGSIYAQLAGRAGGQTLNFGLNSGDKGTLHSNPFKDNKIYFGDITYFNEATGQWVMAGPVADVRAYGALASASDNLSAIQACIDAVAPWKGTVLIPEFYNIAGELVLPSTPITIRGHGQGQSGLIQKTASKACFKNIQSVQTNVNSHIFDMTIKPYDGTVTGVIGCQFTLCNHTHVENVEFLGCSYSVIIDRGRNHKLINLVSGEYTDGTHTLKAGTLKIYSSSDSDHIFEVWIDNYYIWNTGIGVNDPAIYFRRVISSYINKFNVTGLGNVTGILIENDCQGVGIINPTIAAASYGILFQTGSGVGAVPIYCWIMGGEIDQASTMGLQITNGNHIRIENLSITSSGVATNIFGMLIGSGVSDVTVIGCHVSGYDGGGVGIFIGASQYISVIGNEVSNTTYGIDVGVDGADHINISNNILSNAVTTPILNQTTYSHMIIKNNLGYNPVGNVAPTIPTSTVAYTNAYGQDCQVTIYGGVVTVIAVNGTTTGLTTGTFFVPAGGTITITYSSVPTWTWNRN